MSASWCKEEEKKNSRDVALTTANTPSSYRIFLFRNSSYVEVREIKMFGIATHAKFTPKSRNILKFFYKFVKLKKTSSLKYLKSLKKIS